MKDVLVETLSQRKARNPAYSLRALARYLGVSPSFLSEVVSGKKGFSPMRAQQLREKLLPTTPETPATPGTLTNPVE